MCNGTYAMETFDINRKGARGLYLGGTNTSVNLEQQLRTTLKLLNDVVLFNEVQLVVMCPILDVSDQQILHRA
eukprot:2662359-Pyramimonas_sp.AAC.1